jgi:hypothetical protein
VAKNRKIVDNWPQTGHIQDMQKATPNAPTGSNHEEKRHRFYMDPDELALFDKAAALNNRTRSEIIARQGRSYIKQNLGKLRAAGVKIPKDFFVKIHERRSRAKI